MFNIGGGELLVILLLALIVLGPQRLPGAMRQVGNVLGEIRRISNGFQTDLRSALDEAEREAEREARAKAASDVAPAAGTTAVTAPDPVTAIPDVGGEVPDVQVRDGSGAMPADLPEARGAVAGAPAATAEPALPSEPAVLEAAAAAEPPRQDAGPPHANGLRRP